MASERKNGLAPVPSGLFRPTANAAQAEPVEAPDVATDEVGQGGERPASDVRASGTRTRRKRVPAGGETRGRKLSLSDAIFDRLQLQAIRRRATVSAVAAEILDRNLPRLRIEQD